MKTPADDLAAYVAAFDRYQLVAADYRAGTSGAAAFLAARRDMEAALATLEAAEAEFYAAGGDRCGDAYSFELTAAGEQAVIPGCERNAAPGARQLELFG